MRNKQIFFILSIITAVLYTAVLVVAIVHIANGVFDGKPGLMIGTILIIAFFAGLFMRFFSRFLNQRTIVSSLQLENMYSLGQRSAFYNLYAFEQHANILRKSMRFIDKPQYIVAFSASSFASSRTGGTADELSDLNSRIAYSLSALFAKRGGEFDRRHHVFCFDRGNFVIHAFNRNREQIENLVVTIRDRIYAILAEKHYHVYVQPFFGIAAVSPDKTLMTLIDDALLAKENAERNFETFSHYDAKMRKVESADDIAEITKAFEDEEFVVYYQPKFSLAKREFVSAEALIRWHSPKYGIVPPARFIGRMEAAGLLHELDVYVFKKTCADLAEQKRRGRRLLPVSVNFSLYEFYSADFLASILATIDSYGIDPSLIEIEITETTSQANQFLSLSIIKRLREKGMRVLMDDFGIGYSNIVNLRKIPFDAVKIDKSFIDAMREDPRAKELIKLIIGLCHASDREAIAEGVDSKEEVDFLRKAHCDTIQGFYYSKALPKEEYEAFLKENPFEGGKRR